MRKHLRLGLFFRLLGEVHFFESLFTRRDGVGKFRLGRFELFANVFILGFQRNHGDVLLLLGRAHGFTLILHGGQRGAVTLLGLRKRTLENLALLLKLNQIGSVTRLQVLQVASGFLILTFERRHGDSAFFALQTKSVNFMQELIALGLRQAKFFT